VDGRGGEQALMGELLVAARDLHSEALGRSP
jgi:hypothetical protein